MMQRYAGWRAGALAVVGGALSAVLASAPAQAQCVGDCNGDGMVAINELITGVNIALGSATVSTCPSFDVNGDGMVAINELILAVNNALGMCPVANTPTNTVVLDTPTPEATPTVTEVPTPAEPLGSHVCTLGEGSQLGLETASLPLNLLPTGTVSIDCGGPGADGTASCACQVIAFDPVVIPAIGDVCVNPAEGCDPGVVDCDGGTPMDVNLNADHNIGTCTTNTGCAAACDAHCATLGAGFARLNYGCEGWCQGGERNEMACAMDSDCPGGQCPGRDPVNHPDTCNCVCSAAGIGDPSAAGGLSCEVGTQINVELPSNGRCGDTVTIRLAPVCGAVSTETSTGLVLNANNTAGATIPVMNPPAVVGGAVISCDSFRAGTLTGLKMVGQLGFFDSTLGDIRSGNTFVCE